MNKMKTDNKGLTLPTIVASAILAGCAVGPDYSQSEVGLDSTFVNADDRHYLQTAPEQTWWAQLGDEQISELVKKALIENHDLRIAKANVARARAFLRQDHLDRFPVVTASGSVNRNNSSDASFGVPLDSTTFYDAGFDALWELDFFGRIKRNIEAANAEYEAAVADAHDVAVIVAAEVVRTCVELRGAQLRLDVTRQNANNQKQTYELTEVLLENGRGTQLDVSRAIAQLETTKAGIAPLEATIARAIHRLGVLVGQSPVSLTEQLTVAVPLPELPSVVAIGDPAGMLRRRADIRAAERRVAATTARVGVATADLFPRVTVLGSAGLLSTSAGSFGDSGTSRTSIGPFISWPAFDLGRVRARIDAADANVDAQLAAYEQTVLRALEETENSLIDYSRTHRRKARLAAAVTASKEAVELARERYQSGTDSFLNVLDTERRLFEAQNLLATAETDSALAFVSLYKSLGGGWETQ